MQKMIRNGIVTLAMVLGVLLVGNAQITLPYGPWSTSVPVSQLNTNLTTLSSSALARNGGTITGNISVNSGNTIDGVDISAALGGSGTPTFSTVTLTGTGASAIDVAGGVNAGSGNVGIIGTDGRIPALTSTYVNSLDGSVLTNITSTNVTTTWATPSYSAGDYTTNGAGGWTVDAGDIFANRYSKIGKVLHWSFVLTTTTVTAATGTQLRVRLPGSSTANCYCSGSFTALNNGVAIVGTYQSSPSDTLLYLYTDAALGTAWAAAANNTQIRFNGTIEIQ